MNTTQILELLKVHLRISVANSFLDAGKEILKNSNNNPPDKETIIRLGHRAYEACKKIHAIDDMLILNNKRRYNQSISLDAETLIAALDNETNAIDPNRLLNKIQLSNDDD